ncbi:Hypothetical_protein [Hexamita inflata]|uniref:Hypothetical_protein n=1 Tax=Hexamita inflata TaxID=28002 RepID=A0AA86PJ05_9EUKA|nr:Hypothetical protein HINF_LOCUS23844 [Hexamita inflata]
MKSVSLFYSTWNLSIFAFNLYFKEIFQNGNLTIIFSNLMQQQIEYIDVHYIHLGIMWKLLEQPCSDVPGVSGNEIYLATIYKSRKHLLSRIGVQSFPRPTAMVKAIISKMVTNHQSTQISCNNKSSILMCTTSISDLCGSRQNSSAVTFQVFLEMKYISQQYIKVKNNICLGLVFNPSRGLLSW